TLNIAALPQPLHIQHFTFNIQHCGSAATTPHSTLNIQHCGSAATIQHSTFNIKKKWLKKK
ncbi:MAG: hypothetical protein SPE27_07300, partial [Prevotella sp.]|nr:hypothetical protein [Prevotella sp.]